MPMNAEAEALDQLIRQIRRAFQDLRVFGDDLHADDGITSAMRAVMEFCGERGPETVPAIARERNVSRQHIQIIADGLVDRGLAELRDNPRHRRSRLLALTRRGEDVFQDIRRREAQELQVLADGLSEQDVSAAAATLAALRSLLVRR